MDSSTALGFALPIGLGLAAIGSGIGFSRAIFPRLVDDHRRGAVDLVKREQPVGWDAQGLGNQGAVLPYGFSVVARAETAIERAVNAL